jgi:hypothetical protein
VNGLTKLSVDAVIEKRRHLKFQLPPARMKLSVKMTERIVVNVSKNYQKTGDEHVTNNCLHSILFILIIYYATITNCYIITEC